MGLTSTFLRACFLILLFAWVVHGQADTGQYDVMAFGAKADGKSDDSKAFLSAWAKACAWSQGGTPKVIVPPGTYMAGPMNFKGPCKSTGILFQHNGILKSLTARGTQSWISFGSIDGLVISGNGKFDGQGAKAWSSNKCAVGGKCNFPINIWLNFLNNAIIHGISSVDSQYFHFTLLSCKGIKFQNVKISAPAESLNTDGIHMGKSEGIEITNTIIETGDDCISVGDGCSNVNITGVFCGPGHGISIGSLGKYDKEEPVTGITTKNCTIKNTMNGVRIKSWPASYPGVASKMVFDDIVMENVTYPIILDQEYCPYSRCNKQLPSQVKISEVTFSNIRGTSSFKEAIQIICSSSPTCDDVKLSNINLKYTGKDGDAIGICKNAKPTITGQVIPPTCV